MKAIIMAAGKGSRISGKIGDIPKSMLEINSKPIIRITVEMLISLGITPIVCTGYKSNVIKEALGSLDVRFYHNPFFDVTNNIASLWFARSEIDDDIILLSADLVFQQEILEKLMNQDYPFTMAIDKSRILDGDFFFKLDDNDCVLDFSPEMPVNERSCEYMGLSKINRKVAGIFLNRLDNMIEAQKHSLYYENIMLSFINDKKLIVNTVDVSEYKWREIDFYNDYQKALKQFAN